MKELAENEEITAIMSMHTGAQYIFVPFSDTVSKRIRRRHDTTRKQISLANVMWAASDGFFTGTGVVYDMNDYTADGTMTDWMAGKLNVPYAITFEMYGTPGDLANCFEQFNPPGNMVKSTLERIHDMYSAAFLYLIHKVLKPSHNFVPLNNRWFLMNHTRIHPFSTSRPNALKFFPPTTSPGEGHCASARLCIEFPAQNGARARLGVSPGGGCAGGRSAPGLAHKRSR